MNAQDMTIKLLENWDSDKEKIYDEITFVKSLMNLTINKNNYLNKSVASMKKILYKYKQEYNTSNINNFYIYITIYNKATNSGDVGYINNNNQITSNLKLAKFFETEKIAEDYFINNYKPPKNFNIEDHKVIKLKFNI